MNRLLNRLKNEMQNITIQVKLITVFIATSMIILTVNMFMYFNINVMVKQLEQVYFGNIRLNELADTLKSLQASLTDYLDTKTSDSIENYYRYEQDYTNLINNISADITNNPMNNMERSIKNMSASYLKTTNQAIEAKRGRNVEKYKVFYQNAADLYRYINVYIYSLNNEQFKNNSSNYKILAESLQYIETVSIIIMIVVAVGSVILIVLVTRTITNPLKLLASSANQVAGGNFDVALVEVAAKDEVGVVSTAFNKMVVNIQIYIEKLKDGMNKERRMEERELLMQTHLKDAQLKYLQAQINPHFLFNTLNAGAQLAMMEGADRTYEYVQHVADFFRYNVRKNNDTVTIGEEIEMVDNYIYILNVRFSGQIHFRKYTQDKYMKIRVPSMILQPIVENSINYGIRNIDWQGLIELSVFSKEDKVCISIKDNGIGMSRKLIDKIINSRLKADELSADSNGVGLGNVIGRLRLLYEYEDVFNIISEGENKGTEVLIFIPYKNDESTEGERS
ncbi:histidine kinase/DNA gyrase B/HSP90-like ATPase [Ruminiclostridium sufflavum DSM 19573]|uniref:histidine kinase n=1 Tax=Ruminiclostridium sufflavum DSM 19573 TaxID=1121337 RepID=A0A318XK72_9FIRM|nr:histidine kinase [Ruminiclostridium sufflavum]PYG87433.1 histidine kinase/DNA gyrase B/HSP90-like ATPase [Ruminiclostridium sufflavum DSM 19573]